MNYEEKAAEIRRLLGDEMFEVLRVDGVNFKVAGQPGHPFTIGPRHVGHANDHHGGFLSEETLAAIPCAAQGCHAMYADHTHDTAVFLKLRRNLENAEASNCLMQAKPFMEANGIDGLVLVETAEGYRVAAPKPGATEPG